MEVVIFQVAGQRFGVRSSCVSQIVRAATLTPAVRPARGVLGLLNLRGKPVVVFDVRQLLAAEAVPLQASDHLIVLQLASRMLALRAEQTEGLQMLPTGELDAASGVLANCDAVEGIVQAGERLVILLDPNKLLPENSLLRAEI